MNGAILEKYGLDPVVVERLFAVGKSGEGSLFLNFDSGIDAQLRFLDDTLARLKPKRIIETGAHKCFFGYFCICRLGADIVIDNVDVATWSAKAAEIINQLYGKNIITFHFGGSIEIMPTIPGPYDLGYVDGGHTTDICKSDIRNMIRMGVPAILVDDAGEMTIIKDQVVSACEEYKYKITGRTDEIDNRGLLLMEKINA